MSTKNCENVSVHSVNLSHSKRKPKRHRNGKLKSEDFQPQNQLLARTSCSYCHHQSLLSHTGTPSWSTSIKCKTLSTPKNRQNRTAWSTTSDLCLHPAPKQNSKTRRDCSRDHQALWVLSSFPRKARVERASTSSTSRSHGTSCSLSTIKRCLRRSCTQLATRKFSYSRGRSSRHARITTSSILTLRRWAPVPHVSLSISHLKVITHQVIAITLNKLLRSKWLGLSKHI